MRTPETPDATALRQRARGLPPHDAESLWLQLLQLAADDPEALYGLGNGAAVREDYTAAAGYFERALASNARHAGVLNNLGIAYDKMGRLGEAERCFRQALEADPGGLAGNVNLAQNLYRQGRFAQSLPYYERVASHITDDPVALANMGICLTYGGRFADAEKVLQRAHRMAPQSQAIACDHSLVFSKQERWVEAARILEDAWRMARGDLRTGSMLQFARANIADWRDPSLRQFLIERLGDASAAVAIPVDPYPSLAFTDDPGIQLASARSWTRDVVEMPAADDGLGKSRSREGPLRLGFVSSDFTNHPVTRLLLGLLERIDPARFSVFAYSTQPRDETALRSRVREKVRAIRDVERMGPAEQAAAIREDAIDILVDLNGFSGNLTVPTFAQRPAKLQLSFLYAGTLGTRAYDYIVGDRYSLPPAELAHYAESPLFIDPCYLPSDPMREGGEQPLPVTRAEYGLPESGFVFGAWQAHYKITAEIFAAWMRLLHATTGSVLWLRDSAPTVRGNLAREAQRHGVQSNRLVFSAADPLPRYLARMRLADLMLDSFPYGAHTTVNDALYAGIPVVTQTGRSFASRASASQLIAVGLPDLVATSQAQYVEIALRLASNRTKLDEVTTRLRKSAATSALFDMARYANAFQSAVEAAWADKLRPSS